MSCSFPAWVRRLISRPFGIVLLAPLIACSPAEDQPTDQPSVEIEPPPPVPVPSDSDVAAVVARALSKVFAEAKPDVATAVGEPSVVGVEAWLDGTAGVAFASRKLSEDERALARSQSAGVIEHVIGHDALVVWMHHDNPAKSLSIRQLAKIFGDGGQAEKWIDLELKVPGCYSGEIERFRLPNDFDATEDFRSAVLKGNRGFKAGGQLMPSSKELVFQVERTPCAIGYTSLIYVIERAKRTCIDPEAREYTPTDYPNDCVYPDAETTGDGTYSLTRPLVLLTRSKPQGAVKEYLEWILSDAGQCVLEGEGFAPVRRVDCPQETARSSS